MRLPAVLTLFLLAALPNPLLAQKDWIEIQTPSFLNISNARKKASEDFVRQLEQFQEVVGELFGIRAVTSIPLLVVTFRDDQSFTPYKFLVNGKPADVGGFFQRGRDFDVIAVNVDPRNTNPAGIIFHEYVHRLTSYGSRPWPSWLNEGIAEFYSSFEFDGETVTLGAPLQHHVEFLQKVDLLSLERLLAINRDSPEYVHSEKKSIFYAQSWALVHYLMMAEKGAFRSQLIKFSELIDLGYELQDAFYRSFDFDLAQLESRLGNYISQSSYFVSKYRVSSSDTDRKYEAQPLSEARKLVHLGDLLRAVGRKEDARSHYTRAISREDSSGRARLGLGILDWEDEDFGSARTELEAAQRLSPQDPLVSYYLTDIEIQALEDLPGELPAERVDQLFADLERSIQLRPDLTGHRRLFGELAILSNQRLADATEQLDEALERDPDDDRLRVTLVQVLMAVPDYQRAQDEVEILRNSDNLRVIDFAESVGRKIDQILASLETGPAGFGDPDQLLPECSPAFVDVRGLPFLEGLLRQVQCGLEEVVFILSVDGVEHSFRDPLPQDPVVFSCGLTTTQMTCGDLSVPARIYYQDLKEAGRRALAVELKP